MPGTIVLFIRWRGGATRRRISFWHFPWPPSYGVDVTAGGLHRQGDGTRVHLLRALHAPREAEPRPPPADLLFANPVGGGGGASTHHLAGASRRRRRRPRSSPRVHLLRALHARARRSRARRRPIFFLRIRLVAAVARAQRATGSTSPPAACTGKVMAAFTCFVHYTRARGGAAPAAGRFSFCESGWWRRWREHSELRGRRRRRRLAPAR